MAKKKRKIGKLLTDADLKRRYPESAIASTICLPEEKVLKLPCRVVSINHHLGGGISYGKIVENMGQESTGKTLLAMDFGVVAQSMGGVVLWDDAEATFDGNWAQKHGLDLKRVQLLPYENEIEKVSDWMADNIVFWRNKLTHNEPILLVVDSIALLEGADQMEQSEQDSKAEMGRRSFKMGQLLRKRTKYFAKYGVCVYFINQIRKKVGASQFEDPDITPLDQCMKYYASQRFGLYRGKRIKTSEDKKGKWVGNIVHVRTKKSKTSAPRDNVQAKVYFREWQGNFGYDKYFGLEEILVEKGILIKKDRAYYRRVKKKGKKATEVLVAQNFSELSIRIIRDQELRKILLKKAGINTPSQFREQLAATTRNMYPVNLKVSKDSSVDDDEEEEDEDDE